MGIAKNAEDVDKGSQIVCSFPKFRNLPIILSESDPEGCAACSARVYPQNAYRNGPLYASYTAAMMKSDPASSPTREKTNIAGMLTWAFEFEDQPWFDGFRTLATNGVDKPVLNFFRMAGLMRGDRVRSGERSAVALGRNDEERSFGAAPRRCAGGCDGSDEISVLAWNYHDDDVPAEAASVRLQVEGIPPNARRVLLTEYSVDETHGNSWTAWKAMGSPQHPTPEQVAKLQAAGQLELLGSPKWVEVLHGTVELQTPLPRPGVNLVELSWPN